MNLFGGGKGSSPAPDSGRGGLPSRQVAPRQSPAGYNAAPQGTYGGGYADYSSGRDELLGRNSTAFGSASASRNELFKDSAPRQPRQPPRASAAADREALMSGGPSYQQQATPRSSAVERRPVPQQAPRMSEKSGGYDGPRYGPTAGGKGDVVPLTVMDRPPRITDMDFIALSPADFPPTPTSSNTRYVLVNNQGYNTNEHHVFTAVIDPSVPAGHLGISDLHRRFTRMDKTDKVTVQTYEPFWNGNRVYIGSMDVHVDFARRNLATNREIEADDLEKALASAYKDHIYSPGHEFQLDFQAIKLKVRVSTVKLVDLSMSEAEGEALSDPTARGILVEHPSLKINFFKEGRSSINLKSSSKRRAGANAIIAPDFKFETLGIGGLDAEFGVIFRRAFASRIFPPGLVEKLGLPHVKGMLLYGPPGTGKTLIARQIGKMLNAREPKVINGPEVLNKYVGQSEENIRKMFGDAEKEYKEKGEESGLHIIIFDELDAVCKQRGSTSGGTGVGDSVVNQLLSKLDGVNQLNNILLIGMTNRKDMIDDALLRPGRLEVQIEIGLPDEHGRSQILNIHTSKLKKNGVLAGDVDIAYLAKETKNFSGAEIAGLVRSATSFAMNRHVTANAQLKEDVDSLIVNQADFDQALAEVKPAFGAPESETEAVIRRGIIHYNDVMESIITRARKYWDNSPVSIEQPGSVNNILLHGPPKSGTTALAAHLATLSAYPYVKMITLGRLSSMRDEYAKADYIAKVFADAYKSPYSVVILDEIDLLFEYVPLGPRFSNHLLSVLKGKMKEVPPKGHRLLILSTTCNFGIMEMLDFRRAFSTTIQVPVVNTTEELWKILEEARPFEEADINEAYQILANTYDGKIGLGIKMLLEEAFIARPSPSKSIGQDYAEVIGAAINERLLSRG